MPKTGDGWTAIQLIITIQGPRVGAPVQQISADLSINSFVLANVTEGIHSLTTLIAMKTR